MLSSNKIGAVMIYLYRISNISTDGWRISSRLKGSRKYVAPTSQAVAGHGSGSELFNLIPVVMRP